MFEVIVPIYNGADNLGALVESVRAQSYDKWRMHISSDACTESYEKALEISERLDDDRINVYFTKKRQYTLKNIVQTITDNVPNSRSIVAIIDGDDQLCDNNAFKYMITIRPFYNSITLKVFVDTQKLVLNLPSILFYKGKFQFEIRTTS